MHGAKLINSLRLRNLLSYGSEQDLFELQPLNVLIGPNASGKSNLIEAMSLLQAAPSDIQAPVREGGGVREWICKGRGSADVAEIAFDTAALHAPSLTYSLKFGAMGQSFAIADEIVRRGAADSEDTAEPFYQFALGKPTVAVTEMERVGNSNRYERHTRQQKLTVENFDWGQSVLSQLKDPFQYPEITYLGRQLSRIRIYRGWHFGRDAEPRRPQLPDLPGDFLDESGRNLALVLNQLEDTPPWEPLLDQLRRLYAPVKNIKADIKGGTVQIMVQEDGLREGIPAARLSDGTLRYLCLLSILLHPEPPPLICIEEPELGLHPDIVRGLGKLLLEAAQRTQLIVTTHSDLLVSSLTSVPESVIVCERREGGTRLTRADQIPGFKKWLEDYSLGELWLMGRMGGTP